MSKFDYIYDDIKTSLKQTGLKKNDNIFIYSNLGFFGKLKNAQLKEDYCSAFKNAFLEIIGEEGTLIAPTFSYSFCNNEIFDPLSTPSICGIFSEFLRCDKKSIRSRDANFSIAAIGKNAKTFTENSPEKSFGENSFWQKFLDYDGKFCNLNFDCGSTFIHYVEREIHVPYRYDKPFSGILSENSKRIQCTFYHFVYDLKKTNHMPDFTKFDQVAKKQKVARIANLGKGQIVTISAKESFNLIQTEIKKNPAFLIKGNL